MFFFAGVDLAVKDTGYAVVRTYIIKYYHTKNTGYS
jgi:hypothetical protein